MQSPSMVVAMAPGYSAFAEGPRDCLDEVQDLVDLALAKAPKGAFTFVDYGAADGGTAADLYRKVVLASGRPLTVILNDLPSSDLAALHATARFILGGDADIEVAPGSFFDRVAPVSSVTLGSCTNALHWLSEAPDLGEAIQAEAATPQAKARTEALAAEDLSRFLAARALELQGGGYLVCSCPGKDANGRYLGHNGVDRDIHLHLQQLWNALHDEGCVDRDAWGASILPSHYRTEAEVRAVVEDKEAEAAIRGLRSVRLRTRRVACPYRRRFDQTGDAEAFARSLTGAIRSWSWHAFSHGSHGALDELYRRFEASVREEPDTFSLDHVQIELLMRKARD